MYISLFSFADVLIIYTIQYYDYLVALCDHRIAGGDCCDTAHPLFPSYYYAPLFCDKFGHFDRIQEGALVSLLFLYSLQFLVVYAECKNKTIR